MMKEYILKNDQLLQRNEELIHSQASSIQNLEAKMGHLTTDLRSRPMGTLLSNIEAPKRNEEEQRKAITPRSSQEIESTPNTPQRNLAAAPQIQPQHQVEKEPKNEKIVAHPDQREDRNDAVE